MSQEQKGKPAPQEGQEQTPVEPQDKTAEGQEIKQKADDIEADIDKALEENKADKEALDALVDEIDDVLEENAEEFVKNYVQRGGE